MSLAPNNELVNVQTLQNYNLVGIANSAVATRITNMMHADVQNTTANLGNTLKFKVPPQLTMRRSLVAQMQGTNQLFEYLTIDQELSVGYEYTTQEEIFNIEPGNYLPDMFSRGVEYLSTGFDSQVLRSLETQPFLFYGDGVRQINSQTALAQANAALRDYGSVPGRMVAVVPTIHVPQIVGSMANMFAPARNEGIVNSWELGIFNNVEYFESNLLPRHEAGNVGNLNQTLTVVSTNYTPTAGITEITCSGASVNDDDAIYLHDMGYITNNSIRYMNYTNDGLNVSNKNVQFRITEAAGADSSGNVVLKIYPALFPQSGSNKNINTNVVAGMTISIIPTCLVGGVGNKNAFILGMTNLPKRSPWTTESKTDARTGISCRTYYGATNMTDNLIGYVHDMSWGEKLTPQYWQKVLYPLGSN